MWTKDQTTAIENEGGALLVAAAAGSGKTAVLVERVLRRILAGADVDRFLLVTYTNAAAAEMRAKIALALNAAIAAKPEELRLRRQLFLLHNAHITTVHAFCLGLVREQAASLGLSPDFRLADETETRILQADAVEDTLEALYEEASEGFASLTDLLTAGRDDSRLSEILLELFQKTRAHPNPEDYLSLVRESLIRGDAEKPFAILLDEARAAVSYGISLLTCAAEEMEGVDELTDTYLPAFLADEARAEELAGFLEAGDWDGAVLCARNLGFDRLKAARGFEDTAFLERLKALRQGWKDTCKAVCEKALFVTRLDASEDTARNAPALCALIDAVGRFSERFATEKRRRNLLDFNDLEHFAVRALLADGRPSALAQSLSARFDEILVDEYQDTNAVQDAIFAALSQNGNNLFFVGDVKQSIYGFRLANPQIFLEKYKSFADAEEAQTRQPRRVVLGQNFRSRAQVLDTVNYIFRTVMSERVGDLTYTAREALYLGAAYPEAENRNTELLLLDTAEKEEDTAKIELEARMVAERIRALLDGGFTVTEKSGVTRPARAQDVAILMRSPNNRAPVYRAALEAVGLTARTDEKAGLLQTSEVGTLVSLLSVIDNPRQDIELVGVLHSPLYGFSEQELAEIRLADKTVAYYDALRLAASTNEKAAAFLGQLDFLREFAADQPVYRLIWEIFDETDAIGLYGSLPCGTQRQKNLLTFFERARTFETQGHRGLFRFVKMLRAMLETGQDFETVKSDDGGAVRIMSIHKSKGLEFPIVILAECAGKFNETDLTAPVLVHPELGVAAKCRDLTRGVQYNTLERQAIAATLRRESISEEMRVLYVALTRAKEKLIVTASAAGLLGVVQKCAMNAMSAPPYAMGRVHSYLPWLLTAILRHPAATALCQQAGVSLAPDLDAPSCLTVRYLTAAELGENTVFEAEEKATEELPKVAPAFDYPWAYLSDLPAKMTATGVKRTYKAEEAAEETLPPRRETVFRRPDFEQTAKGLTASERGTAHHLFMQFARYESLATEAGVNAELKRLREQKIMSPLQIEAIDCSVITRFFRSEIYQKRFAEAKVRREFKFSVLIPAATYYAVAEETPQETVLLQGVIDCLLETEDGFIVLDFKTDRVTDQTVRARAAEYREQLKAYCLAVEKIFEKPVKELILYFFSTGSAISVEK